MFHAVIAKKARIEKIIDGANKHPREDLVTSALFGTVTFLTPAARRVALSKLIGHDLPADAEVILWPRLISGEGTGEKFTEPDVVLKFAGETDPQFWIVEVKWGAYLGENQICREIERVKYGECPQGTLPKGPRKVAGYTLLGKEDKHGSELKTVKDALEPNYPELSINDLTWPDLTKQLRALSQDVATDPGLSAWADAAAAFLSITPQGAVLSKWPDMHMPQPACFHFDAEPGCDRR